MSTFGIRQRVLLVALVPVFAAALSLTLYFTLLRYEDVDNALIDHGASLARHLAPAAEYGMFAGNTDELRRLAKAVVRETDISGITFYDRNGKLLASAGQPQARWRAQQLPDGWQGQSEDKQTLFFHAKVSRVGEHFDDPFATAGSTATSILPLGSLTLEISRAEVIESKRQMLLFTLITASAILAAAALVARRLGQDITEPIVALETAVGRIGHGELNVRLSHHKARTLHALEAGLNEMAAALDMARQQSAKALASSKAQLNEQNEFARAVLQAQSDAGVCMMMLEGNRVVYANEASILVSGFSADEFRDLEDFRHLIKDRGDPAVLAHIHPPLTPEDNARRFETRFQCKNGDWRHFDVATAALQGTVPARVVTIALDITQRKLDEELLARTNTELQRQKDEAERASLAKSRFLAAASHDLRQPLHALTLFASELGKNTDPERQTALIQQIQAASQSLASLLESLLDISRLDLTAIQVLKRPVHLGRLCQSVVESHLHSAHAKGLDINLRSSDCWSESDPQLLYRILSNLIGNAIRYTETGRILIAIRPRQAGVRIEVWDSGIGIAAEHLPHLFDEFYQVANQERDASKGLGLGLAIVARLTQTLDHEIDVCSRPGHGSRFALTLTRLPSPPPPNAGHNAEIPTGRHLMLAMNAGKERDQLCALLIGWGYRITLQSEAASPLPADIDAVLCDAQHLQGCDQVPGTIPLILVGATGTASDNRLAGALRFPVRPAQLRALLQHLGLERTE